MYTSFLPDIEINREYVEKQKSKYEKRQICTDQWLERDESSVEIEEDFIFSGLGRKLIGIDKWI